MDPSVLIYALIVFGGLGLYYWFSFGRHGGLEGYHKHQFKLKEGEGVTTFFHGAYNLEKEKKDIALALVGVERVGKPLIFAITNQNRLIFRENANVMADEPISLEGGSISQIELSEEYPQTMVGLSGQLEKMKIITLTLLEGQKISLIMPKSGAEAIESWHNQSNNQKSNE